jgi:hypothetical protein
LNSNKINTKRTTGIQHDSTYAQPNLLEVGCEFHGLAVHAALEEILLVVCPRRNQFTFEIPPLTILDVIALLLKDH